ncbi:MAG: MerR family transcriptional regulator [Acidimicrobiia bacterium]
MAGRSHLSIGEVLSLLQDEFPDITISKIRFLESQGLLDPERTPSGYRKFYESDIEQLRWILQQQKENFLPLKVIKDRLEESAAAGLVVPPDEPAAGVGEPAAAEGAPAGRDGTASAAPGPVGDGRDAPVAVSAVPTPPSPSVPPGPARSAESRAGAQAARPTPAGRLDAGVSGVSLTRQELCDASGLVDDELADLERFGLVTGRVVGADRYFDEDDLVVARSAAGFLRFGIEARHLRMYKVAAEREAGFFEQVIMPLVKQRNPQARQQAADRLDELSRLGESLHAALLRVALGDHTRR